APPSRAPRTRAPTRRRSSHAHLTAARLCLKRRGIRSGKVDAVAIRASSLGFEQAEWLACRPERRLATARLPVPGVRCDVEERAQRERSLRQARVRYGEAGFVHVYALRPKKVEVDRSRPPAFSPDAAERALDLEGVIEQLP